MAGTSIKLVHRRIFHDRAGIENGDAIDEAGDQREVVGDPDDGHAELGAQILHQIDDLGLDRHVERGRRLVGDQKLRIAGKADRDHHALAHAARKLVRIGHQPLFGTGNADEAQKLDGACARIRLRHPAMIDQRLANLVADAHDRIERGHRILEDEADIAAAHLAQVGIGHLLQVAPVEIRRTLRHLDLVRQKPHQAEHRQALAAAGFADDAKRLALVDIEVDAIDDDGGAAARIDLDGEILHVQQAFVACCVHHLLPRGLSASLRPSPRKLKATEARPSTAAGAARRCG